MRRKENKERDQGKGGDEDLGVERKRKKGNKMSEKLKSLRASSAYAYFSDRCGQYFQRFQCESFHTFSRFPPNSACVPGNKHVRQKGHLPGQNTEPAKCSWHAKGWD